MSETMEKIKQLEQNQDWDNLASYLIDVAKHDDNPLQYENEFKKYLSSNNWYLKKAAVFSLLFVLQIAKLEYRNKAIAFIKDFNEDKEVRTWSAMGLAQSYQKSQDKELLALFFATMENLQEQDSIKETMFQAALLVYGITTREQFLRNDEANPSLADMLKTFELEFVEMKKIIT